MSSIQESLLINNLERSGHLENGLQILSEFQSIASNRHLEFPFWNPKIKDNIPIIEKYQRGPFVIIRGSLENFEPSIIATIIDATTKRFYQKNLFDGFPWYDDTERNNLIAAMISGFSSDRLVVAVLNSKQTEIIGGCMIVPGSYEKVTVADLIGSNETVLPTFWSLDAHLNGHSQLTKQPEINTVCFTRFFRTCTDTMSFPDREAKNTWLQTFSKEALSGMTLVTQHWAEINHRSITAGYLDTHDHKISDVLINHYGGVLLDDHPDPTPQVKTSPLNWHYNLPNIHIIGFDFNRQLQMAKQVDAGLGEKTPI